MTRPYAPNYGQDAEQPQFDPDLLAAYGLALRLHEGRFLCLPRLYKPKPVAPGVEWTISVPSGVIWHPMAINAKLVNAAGGGNRTPTIIISDGTDEWLRFPSAGFGLSGSNTGVWTWVAGYDAVVSFSLNSLTAPLPRVPILPNLSISSLTSGIAAGDQWTAMTVYVLEIRERTPNETSQYMQDVLAGKHEELYPGLLIGV